MTVILWLIHSEGVGGRSMRRKDIEASITTWFEVTSSANSKAVRQMAQPKLGLATIAEDPASGREKIVSLNPKGERFLAAMIANGAGHIGKSWLSSAIRRSKPGSPSWPRSAQSPSRPTRRQPIASGLGPPVAQSSSSAMCSTGAAAPREI